LARTILATLIAAGYDPNHPPLVGERLAPTRDGSIEYEQRVLAGPAGLGWLRAWVWAVTRLDLGAWRTLLAHAPERPLPTALRWLAISALLNMSIWWLASTSGVLGPLDRSTWTAADGSWPLFVALRLLPILSTAFFIATTAGSWWVRWRTKGQVSLGTHLYMQTAYWAPASMILTVSLLLPDIPPWDRIVQYATGVYTAVLSACATEATYRVDAGPINPMIQFVQGVLALLIIAPALISLTLVGLALTGQL
jgi:hypothetical protein